MEDRAYIGGIPADAYANSGPTEAPITFIDSVENSLNILVDILGDSLNRLAGLGFQIPPMAENGSKQLAPSPLSRKEAILERIQCLDSQARIIRGQVQQVG